MIAKANGHNNGARLAAYLVTGKSNEKATLWQLRGFASQDIREAFRSIHVLAKALPQLRQPFFHVQVRNPDGEALSPEQWEYVADRIEQTLSLGGQPRAIAFHRDGRTGYEHMHLVFSRIDDRAMKAIPLPFHRLRLMELCRELEIELGLTQVRSQRSGRGPAPTHKEYEQARRLGIDIHAIREAIRECWERSDNGRSFQAALAERGLILARGDRRAFTVIDRSSGVHALGRRILGISAAEIRSRLLDLDQQDLPTVDEARIKLGYPTSSRNRDEIAYALAVEERDPVAILELVTKYRATFTARDLNRAIGRYFDDPGERRAFVAELLIHPQVLQLAGKGITARYTTQVVLESEQQVLQAAENLVRRIGFAMPLSGRAPVLGEAKYADLSPEQIAAIEHATGATGLALIEGQAGTGKSYIMAATREIYERSGFTVVGLGPTNIVAQDLGELGFTRARTLHSELAAIDRRIASWNERTVVILDEAAMVDTRYLARLLTCASKSGTKAILVGDARQLPSVERGGMFPLLKARYGTAELTEVRRQRTAEDRQASMAMAQGNFRGALDHYRHKAGITWTETHRDAAQALVDQWAKDSAGDPATPRFVFAYTNRDVDELNREIREKRIERGELGPSTRLETTHGPADFAANDRIQFTGTCKRTGIYNGHTGTIEWISGSLIKVTIDGSRKQSVEFDAREFQDFRHGYAGTIYKGQGRSIEQTYLLFSHHWWSAPSYVALTRHRDRTRLFVARETVADFDRLVWQIARFQDHRAASYYLQAEPARRSNSGTQKSREPARVFDHLAGGRDRETSKIGRQCAPRNSKEEEHVFGSHEIPRAAPTGRVAHSKLGDFLRTQFREAKRRLTSSMLPSHGRTKRKQSGGGTNRAFMSVARSLVRRIHRSCRSFCPPDDDAWASFLWLHMPVWANPATTAGWACWGDAGQHHASSQPSL